MVMVFVEACGDKCSGKLLGNLTGSNDLLCRESFTPLKIFNIGSRSSDNRKPFKIFPVPECERIPHTTVPFIITFSPVKADPDPIFILLSSSHGSIDQQNNYVTVHIGNILGTFSQLQSDSYILHQ
jgi:hypothetical protein